MWVCFYKVLLQATPTATPTLCQWARTFNWLSFGSWPTFMNLVQVCESIWKFCTFFAVGHSHCHAPFSRQKVGNFCGLIDWPTKQPIELLIAAKNLLHFQILERKRRDDWNVAECWVLLDSRGKTWTQKKKKSRHSQHKNVKMRKEILKTPLLKK